MAKKKSQSKRIDETANEIQGTVDHSLDERSDRLNRKIEQVIDAANKSKRQVLNSVIIDLDLISTDQNNRIEVDTDWEEYKSLKESIKRDGVLNPPSVYVNADRTEIICLTGHLRIKAMRELGFKDCSFKYLHFPDKEQRTRVQLLENIARKNIHPVEFAESLAKIEDTGMTVDEVAKEACIHIQTARNYLNIGKWDLVVRKYIHERMSFFASKTKALHSLGWKASKENLKPDEILRELRAMVEKAPTLSAKQKKVIKAKKILEGYSDDNVAIIKKFLSKYDGISSKSWVD